ncbi:hypothetical protein TUM3794_20800 [Shewanella colwelliana]|uniref:Dystroglycan-type cadherin-like domain-containing protein n=1 Tax=Shewanella colwelliana TaxID=23 RepID=A0ABQ4P0S2_SHECO|nr:hypothetical protein [Shewanella colwelliana]GIU41102.1 hypothetical protein TUM3794_20800 [Shewanella colwelliana]
MVRKSLGFALCAFLLTACGGSDGDNAKDEVVTLPPTPPVAENVLPSVFAGVDFEVSEEQSVSLIGEVSDEDGVIESLVWVQEGGPDVDFTVEGVNLSFVAPIVPEETQLTFKLSATDDEGGVSSDVVVIKVKKLVIESVAQAIDVLERRGELTVLDRTASLGGVDDNNDGIRDDIYSFVVALPLETAKRNSLLQLAQAFQSIQTRDIENPSVLSEVDSDIVAGVVCNSIAFDNPTLDSSYGRKIRNFTANTYERAERFARYNALMNGSVTRLPEDSEVECK